MVTAVILFLARRRHLQLGSTFLTACHPPSWMPGSSTRSFFQRANAPMCNQVHTFPAVDPSPSPPPATRRSPYVVCTRAIPLATAPCRSASVHAPPSPSTRALLHRASGYSAFARAQPPWPPFTEAPGLPPSLAVPTRARARSRRVHCLCRSATKIDIVSLLPLLGFQGYRLNSSLPPPRHDN